MENIIKILSRLALRHGDGTWALSREVAIYVASIRVGKSQLTGTGATIEIAVESLARLVNGPPIGPQMNLPGI